MPSTYSVVPVPLYQGACRRGSRSKRSISADLHRQQHRDAGREPGRPQASSSATTTACGAAITTQASRAARSDAQHHRQRADAHPAVALDRLEVVQRHDAVRAEAVERRTATMCGRGQAPAAIIAAPVNQGSPS